MSELNRRSFLKGLAGIALCLTVGFVPEKSKASLVSVKEFKPEPVKYKLPHKHFVITTTNEYGPGSIREALMYPGARTITMGTEGYITFTKPLDLDNPNCAIVGHYAVPNYKLVSNTFEKEKVSRKIAKGSISGF